MQQNYRKQLIGLAKLYGVVEIKNYLRSSKRVTNSQIELLLIKNNIRLPKKSLPKYDIKKSYLNQIYYTLAAALIIVGFFGGAPNIINLFNKIDLGKFVTQKIEKQNKDSFDEIFKKGNVVLPESQKEIIYKKEKHVYENTVRLNSSTISLLFEETKYDLSEIRKGKKVKPVFISLLPGDLKLIEQTQERKELFIKIVLPLILEENSNILQERKKLFKIINKNLNTNAERKWLINKFKEYKINNSDISELKLRMDIIPVSIAIAQAAKESGWGTSRFAVEGNALYGQWTWNNNGLEPLEKDSESNHKVMQFNILRASVRAYKNNLNTHNSYKEFREARANLRNQKKKIQGVELTKYLHKYAETGKKYTKVIKLIIEQNSLSDFDNVKLLSTKRKKEITL